VRCDVPRPVINFSMDQFGSGIVFVHSVFSQNHKESYKIEMSRMTKTFSQKLVGNDLHGWSILWHTER